MTDKEIRKRTLWQMLMLAVILVGFPLGSWVYLTKGFNYQMAAREQLRKTDQLPAPDDFQLVSGELAETLIGNMFIVTLVPNSDKVEFDKLANTITDLHNQFDVPKNIQFWTVFEEQDSSFITDFISSNEMVKDEEQLIYFNANKEQFTAFTDQLGFNETELTDRGMYPQFLMVDDSLFIRRVFRADMVSEVKQLVEATALLLPERSKPKARVVRETEK